MRNLLIAIFSLTLSMTAAAQAESLTLTTLSPFMSATRMLESTNQSTIASALYTFLTNFNAKGVAGREQIRDEVVALNQDIVQGVVKSIQDVRQPAVREFMEEISRNEEQLREIDGLIQSGDRFTRMATAISLVLIIE
jgi:hypothetical protein